MYDVCVVGGCGHVGLPLAIALANKGKKVCIQDIDENAVRKVATGKMPFAEDGADKLLLKAIEAKNLSVSSDPSRISDSRTVICIVGTPVDEHLNPKFDLMRRVIEQYCDYFKDGQLLILRSTVFPGTTGKVAEWLAQKGKKMHVAFCPERILEGKAMSELSSLPQIISSMSAEGLAMSYELFSSLTSDIVQVEPIEAELAKLFSNVWRYIKFAVANQFYMITNNYDVNFYNVYHAMTHKYDRAKDFPRPGFAAGPCLFKDAMQLGAFNNGDFYLGHTAMLINEGLPNYMVKRLKQKHDLSGKTVGILGMAFKASSDDIRESLSYKLKKILELEAKDVLCTDPLVKDDRLLPLENVIARSDIVIIATPHIEYSKLDLDDKIVADIWNVLGKGGII
jgi:UDP-N-acetyl-D-mannosaminuronic acid dehydrogenase